MSGPTIKPIIAIETTPFENYDGTHIGVNALIKKTEGQSALSAFGNAENFLYRMHKTVVNDMKKENPTEADGGPSEKRQTYEEMFPDYKKEYDITELTKVLPAPAPVLGGKKKSKRKTKKSKRRIRRSKKNKK